MSSSYQIVDRIITRDEQANKVCYIDEYYGSVFSSKSVEQAAETVISAFGKQHLYPIYSVILESRQDKQRYEVSVFYCHEEEKAFSTSTKWLGTFQQCVDRYEINLSYKND